MQYSPRCKESRHLQFKRGKYIITTQGMEKTLVQERGNTNCNIVKYFVKYCKYYFCKKSKMRNMKILHMFQIIVIKREEKFQESLWENKRPKATLECEKPRVKYNQKVILEYDICNFLIWEKGRNFSSHTFCWSINESRLFSSFSLVLWVVSCGRIC